MLIYKSRGVSADIVIPDQATETEIYAAKELKKYLQLSTDAVFLIVQEKKITSRFNIYLGKTDMALKMFGGEYEGLGQDAFCIHTKGDSLFLFGRENIYSQSATLYSVGAVTLTVDINSVLIFEKIN